MCFSDCLDHNRFWVKNVLRLDLDLWTSIINNSGLFDNHGRYLPKEWRSWTRNGKTITFEKATTKNRDKHAMFCCYSEEFAQFKNYGGADDSIGVMNVRWADLVSACFDLETLRLSDVITTTHESDICSSSSKSSSSNSNNNSSSSSSSNSISSLNIICV